MFDKGKVRPPATGALHLSLVGLLVENNLLVEGGQQLFEVLVFGMFLQFYTSLSWLRILPKTLIYTYTTKTKC